MNSRERFLSALKGEKVDRPPIAHISALTTVELQKIVGCFMPEVHMNAEQLVKLCFANHEVLGFDGVTFIINYFNEPAALGVKMDWGDFRHLPMYLSHPWDKEEDAIIPKDLLRRVPISTCLESITIAKEKYGNRVAVLGKIMGPFSMVQVMYGVERTMTDLINNPKRIKYFLEIALEILIECGNAQFKAGADALAIGEGGAGGNMLSPQMHEEFLYNIHKKLIKNLKGPTIMHMCGDITPRLELISHTGITCFNFDWLIKPSVMKEFSKGKFKIMGNINTTDLLKGKPEEIEKQVIENIKAGTDIISPGCAISPECPNKNLTVISQTIKNFFRFF